MILRPYSRSCRTASIRSGIAGGLAGELEHAKKKIRTKHQYEGCADYHHALTEGQISHSGEPAIVSRKLFWIDVGHGTSPG